MTRRSLPRRTPALLLILVLILAALAAPALRAAAPAETPNAAEIRLALAKLNVVGGVLYVAAHPDDENTAFLAWASREKLVDAGYLSMTRGDGGRTSSAPSRASSWASSARRSFSRRAAW